MAEGGKDWSILQGTRKIKDKRTIRLDSRIDSTFKNSSLFSVCLYSIVEVCECVRQHKC